MDNNEFKIHDSKVSELISLLYNSDKVYGAFIFGSRYYNTSTEDSDYDIALFTDLDFFDIAELVDDYTPLCDVSDICDLPSNIQEDIFDSPDNIIFLKDKYVLNWEYHKDYLKDEINFKEDVRGDLFEL